jgi:acyl transferase domain-containing protein
MVSLARLWQECGVKPAAVIGHSQGEIAAAHIAGALSLQDAARLAAVRSKIISRLAGRGGLLSVALGKEQLSSLLEPFEGELHVAAHNGPSSTILSGPRQPLEELLAQCEEREIRAREVPAAVASHSPHVEELQEEVLETLASLAGGKQSPLTAKGSSRAGKGPVFCFPGQGSQWAGMGIELAEASPAFASHMRSCEEALAPYVDWSLQEALGEEQGKWLRRLDIVQPALFALMVSLARLWQECGVKPAAVIGHSQGEIAAAHIAGALSLEDAARIVALRAKAMRKIAGRGGMLSVSLPLSELEPLLEPYGERLSLAANNCPASHVLSGEPEALDRLLSDCE